MTAWELKTKLEKMYPEFNATVINCAYAGWHNPCLTIYLTEKPCTEVDKSAVSVHAGTDGIDAALEEIAAGVKRYKIQMRETTLADELKIQRSLIKVYAEMPLLYDRLIVGVRASLQTLQRLSEDVDPETYEECERLLEELR